MVNALNETDSLIVKQVVDGRIASLAKLITLLESKRWEHRIQAGVILSHLLPHTGKAIRIGISGPPGVGKSTFIEALGSEILKDNHHKIAILAVDPTSPLSGGSILGDKTRMESLAKHPSVFIRPSPSSGNLGGVNRHTREAILACEAAGFNIVIVETVGVGQSEVDVASIVDVFLVLHLPNSGDELQGIKKGILELADLVVINKADGSALPSARNAKLELDQALSFMRTKKSHTAGSHTPVLLASSTENTGIQAVLRTIKEIHDGMTKSGELLLRRKEQNLAWFHCELLDQLQERLAHLQPYLTAVAQAEADVAAGKTAASTAATLVIDGLFSKEK